MMLTYSGLDVPDIHKEGTGIVHGEAIKFKYSAVLPDKYKYRVAVEDNNALRDFGGTKYQTGL